MIEGRRWASQIVAYRKT